MTRKLISTGSTFEQHASYSRAVVDGDWCFVSGTTGYDYATMEIPDCVRLQTANCLKTIQTTLEDAGFGTKDIVRVRYYVTSSEFSNDVFDVVGEFFRDIRPAATMLVTGLCDPAMKIEIEATALRQSHCDAS